YVAPRRNRAASQRFFNPTIMYLAASRSATPLCVLLTLAPSCSAVERCDASQFIILLLWHCDANLQSALFKFMS
ncbi:unnamed protein product, partial [Citrullus colocynthis]